MDEVGHVMVMCTIWNVPDGVHYLGPVHILALLRSSLIEGLQRIRVMHLGYSG